MLRPRPCSVLPLLAHASASALPQALFARADVAELEHTARHLLASGKVAVPAALNVILAASPTVAEARVMLVWGGL